MAESATDDAEEEGGSNDAVDEGEAQRVATGTETEEPKQMI